MSLTVETPATNSKTTRAELLELLNNQTAAFNAFRGKVYELAKEQKDNEGWCTEGYQKAMSELGFAAEVSTVRKLDLSLYVDLEKIYGDDPEDIPEDEDDILRDVFEYLGGMHDPNLDDLLKRDITIPESLEGVKALDSKPRDRVTNSNRYGYGI